MRMPQMLHSIDGEYKYLFRKRTPAISVFEDTDFNQVSTVWESKAWKYLASQDLPDNTEENLSHSITAAA